jgi:hypothetical protein
MTNTAVHRLSQFWRHAAARVSADELRRVREILGPELSGFFIDLPVNDQRHGLDVLATIARAEDRPPRILQQAALLHDMGKAGAHFSVIERSLTVLLKAVSPHALGALVARRPAFARRYAAYADHARIGADALRQAGATELAAVVAEHHALEPHIELTRRLQRADGLN